jgi:hypothetical protein
VSEKRYHRRQSEDYRAMQFNGENHHAVKQVCGVMAGLRKRSEGIWRLDTGYDTFNLRVGYWVVSGEGYLDVFDPDEFAATFVEVADD